MNTVAARTELCRRLKPARDSKEPAYSGLEPALSGVEGPWATLFRPSGSAGRGASLMQHRNIDIC